MNEIKPKNSITADICIIGGGASGLVAAIKAKEVAPEKSVLIIEKLDSPGHKVAASGNGRCNLSNVRCGDWEKTSAFFSTLGLLTRVDEAGRIYPYSEDGRDVVRTLVDAAEELGVEIMVRREVKSVRREEDGSFTVETEFKKPKAYREQLGDGPIYVSADKLIIATGGKSKPKLGTSGDGYALAKSLGHSVNKLVPVLTGVETVEDIKALGLSGVREKCRITLKADDKELFQDSGEIQFTDYGVSGIVVFDMTRFMDIPEETSIDEGFASFSMEIDFIPELSEETLGVMIGEAANPERALCSMVKASMAKVLIDECRGDKAKLAECLKHFMLHPKGLRGWDMAQVTRGGVPLREVEEGTGESKIVPGLFFAGEILDYDGPCGGFNLQHAWTTGIRAGIAASDI